MKKLLFPLLITAISISASLSMLSCNKDDIRRVDVIDTRIRDDGYATNYNEDICAYYYITNRILTSEWRNNLTRNTVWDTGYTNTYTQIFDPRLDWEVYDSISNQSVISGYSDLPLGDLYIPFGHTVEFDVAQASWEWNSDSYYWARLTFSYSNNPQYGQSFHTSHPKVFNGYYDFGANNNCGFINYYSLINDNHPGKTSTVEVQGARFAKLSLKNSKHITWNTVAPLQNPQRTEVPKEATFVKSHQANIKGIAGQPLEDLSTNVGTYVSAKLFDGNPTKEQQRDLNEALVTAGLSKPKSADVLGGDYSTKALDYRTNPALSQLRASLESKTDQDKFEAYKQYVKGLFTSSINSTTDVVDIISEVTAVHMVLSEDVGF